MSYVAGKAVDVEHGVNTTQVIFDAEDDDDGWKSVDEVEADYYVEHEQDYPYQELTRIYECSNGRTIRETSPSLPMTRWSPTSILTKISVYYTL